MNVFLESLVSISLLIAVLLCALFLLAALDGYVNLGWLICIVLIWRWIDSGVDMFLIPAGMFAIAGSISGRNKNNLSG